MSRKSKLGPFILAFFLVAFGLIGGALLQSGRWGWLAKRIGQANPVASPGVVANRSDQFDLVDLAKKARSAVVSIEVLDDEKKPIATGSGFFVSPDGLVVTNYHVIQSANSAVVKTGKGDAFPVKGAVYFDRDNDVILLSTDAKPSSYLLLGSSSKVEVGNRVAVIGNPLGLEGSLSEGIVSAMRKLPDRTRPLPTPVLEMEHYPPTRNFELSTKKVNWLQITAPISPGSSGSPVMDSDSNVIGIATMVLRGGQSLNFAVPVEIVSAMLQAAATAERPRPLITFQQFIEDEAATQNILQNAFNCSPELAAARKAAGRDQLPYKTKGIDWGKAVDLARIVTEKYPEIPGAWSILGYSCDNASLWADAISAYEETIRLLQRPSERSLPGGNYDYQASTWASIGSIYEKMQQPTQAKSAYSQAVALQKKALEHLPTKLDQIYAEEMVKKLDRAEAIKSLALDKAKALEDLGDYYAGAGDMEDAEQSYLQAIRENPYKGSERQEILFFALAKCCVKNNGEQAAFTKLYDAMILSGRPNAEAAVWEVMSLAYYDAGEREAALRCDDKARRLGLKR